MLAQLFRKVYFCNYVLLIVEYYMNIIFREVNRSHTN